MIKLRKTILTDKENFYDEEDFSEFKFEILSFLKQFEYNKKS